MTDQELSVQAEAVTAYLVTLRGGAPFLSGADGRLLVRWLDQGVPVPTILTALEQVAERRRKRRTRSRLSLNAAKGVIKKAIGAAPDPTAAPTKTPDHGALALARDAYAGELARMTLAPGAESLRAALIDSVRAAPVDSPDAAATAVIAACRRFHEARWASLPAEARAELESECRTALAALADTVDPAILGDLIEEAARDALRARTPLVSAREAWTRLGGSAV
ncbi:MAG: hypothetical protein VX265_06280 [Myxococcota bacterium]|nr:hypothetical protein [Myxococcota bacterium]MEC8423160.1 hypothetical protein [Myxococcota bacterium]